MPKVSPRNTRHEKAQQILTVCLAVYCGVYPDLRDTCRTHIPLVKNRRRIFIMPVPSKKVTSYGNITEQGFGFSGNFQGLGTGLIEISQQMFANVNSAGMCVAKHQPQVLYGFGQI